MANVKITELTAYTNPASTDVVPIVDVGTDTTKKVTIADLLENAGSGTAGAPAFAFDGDSDTGIYRPGTDQVAISTNGTGRLFVDASGNVSVGSNSSISAAFTVVSQSNAEGINIRGRSADNIGELNFWSNDEATRYAKLSARSTFVELRGPDSGSIQFNKYDGTQFAIIDSTGRLGIGTTSPSTLLTLSEGQGTTLTLRRNNSAAVADDLIGKIDFFNNDGSSPGARVTATVGAYAQGTAGGTYLAFSTATNGSSNAERLRIDQSGNVGIGTIQVDRLLHLASATPAIKLQDTDNVEDYSEIIHSTGNLYFDVRNNADDGAVVFRGNSGGTPSERLRIDSSGRLLVGTSTSLNVALNAKLQVAGTGVDGFASISRWDSANPGLIFGASDGGSVGTHGLVANGRQLGDISFTGSDGSGFKKAASIEAYVDGTPGANDMPGRLVFSTTADGASSPTERLRIDSSGNVGIGTAAPYQKLTVRGLNEQLLFDLNTATNGEYASIAWNSSTNDLGTGNYGAEIRGYRETSGAYGALGFHTRGASGTSQERLRIDSSGRLLVGTSSSRPVGSGSVGIFQVEQAAASISASIVNNYDGPIGAILSLGHSRSTSIGSNTLLQANDSLGEVRFAGADGVDIRPFGASIAAQVDGTPGTDDMPGRLVFSTTADGASSPTERMRITAAGNIECNVSSSTQIASILSFTGGQVKHQYRSFGTGSVNIVEFVRDTGGTPTVAGTISTTGSATAYNTSSDYRLKENVTAVTDGITRLQQLKPSRFNFIADTDTVVDGFLAHEVQTIVPEAITGEKDAVDDDGNPVYQGIDQSKLVPLLTAALQEAIGEIESLKARVAALETP